MLSSAQTFSQLTLCWWTGSSMWRSWSLTWQHVVWAVASGLLQTNNLMIFYFTLPHFGSNEERLQSILWLFYNKRTGSRCVLVECISYTLSSGSIVFLFCLPGKLRFNRLFGFKPKNWFWTLYPYLGRNVTSGHDRLRLFRHEVNLTQRGCIYRPDAQFGLSVTSSHVCSTCEHEAGFWKLCPERHGHTSGHKSFSGSAASQVRLGIKTSPVTWFLLCLTANHGYFFLKCAADRQQPPIRAAESLIVVHLTKLAFRRCPTGSIHMMSLECSAWCQYRSNRFWSFITQQPALFKW